MLDHCDALLIGRTSTELAFLGAFSDRLGFRRGIPIGTAAPASLEGSRQVGSPISYFIIHHRVADADKLSILSAVRSSNDRNVSFAPVIILIDDCPCEMVIRYVHWGFDDIISLPEKAYVLRSRLEAHLLSAQTYFESTTYLGPDRRRLERASLANERRGTLGGGYMRYEFLRDPDFGVRIGRRIVAG